MKLIIIMFWLLTTSIFSQQKFEKEYRISLEEVPEKAKSFIVQCKFTKRVKWYGEESQDGKTIEAKSCKNKHKYSIEFDLKGNVLDVEKTIKWKEISEEKQSAIKKALRNRFDKFKIKKVQIQWQTDHEFYIDLINGNGENQINEFYEIVLKGTDEGKTNLFELLIDGSGTVLKELEFAPQNNDNLEF